MDGENDARSGRIYPAYGQTWPSVTLDVGEPICVTFDAGWLDSSVVPFGIKAEILLAAETLYKREPLTLEGSRLLGPYMLGRC